MALGDSIAAGYKMAPVTQAYPYLLYQGGAFDRMPHTLFNNLAAVGATSQDVLVHQVPQALIPAAIGGFGAKYITLTVGGNDILPSCGLPSHTRMIRSQSRNSPSQRWRSTGRI